MSDISQEFMESLLNSLNGVRVSNYTIYEDYVEEACNESYMNRMFNPENMRIIEITDPHVENQTQHYDDDDEEDYDYASDNEEQTLEDYYNESYNSDLEPEFE